MTFLVIYLVLAFASAMLAGRIMWSYIHSLHWNKSVEPYDWFILGYVALVWPVGLIVISIMSADNLRHFRKSVPLRANLAERIVFGGLSSQR